MTSNTDANNDKPTADLDRESQKIYPKSDSTSDQAQMQVSRKESSSGFMLLSVKHLSNVKSSAIANGKEMHPLGESYDDSCMNKSASIQLNNKAMKGNSLDLGRHYSSTISLEAEEYDNDEEEELGSHLKPHHILRSDPPIGHELHSIVHSSQSKFDHNRIGNMECHTNGHHIVDETTANTLSNMQPVDVTPASVPIQASAAQSLYDIPPQTTNGKIPNYPALFRQLNSDVASGSPLESPIASGFETLPSNMTDVQNHQSIHHPKLHSFKFSNPSSDSGSQSANAAAIAINVSVPCQSNISTTLPQLPTRRFNEQNGESMGSFSSTPLRDPLSPSFDAPVQPASRFRKARIHETIEQWALNRLSFHDCRLKVVPSWVSHLQTKPINASLNHQIAQRGRCLYCYVPGSFGFKCNNYKHQNGGRETVLKRQKPIPCSLPTVPESSELSHILQATITAYHSATQQGYNLSSLFTTWNAGERVSGHALLNQVDRSLKNNLNFEANTVESERVEMASHNSTGVNFLLPIGSEDLGANGITNSAHHRPLTTVVKHVPSSGSSPPKINAEKATNVCISDSSVAYLRRQLDLSAVRADDGRPYSPPSQSLNIPSTAEQQMAPPASPAILGKPNSIVRLLDCADCAVASPKTLDSVRSFSATTITSVQLSPDTEVSEMAISNVSDPSSTNHLVLSDASIKDGHNVPTLFAFSDPIQSSLARGTSRAPMDCRSNGIEAAVSTVDLSAAARNIFQVATAAAACVNRQSQLSSHLSGVASGSTSVSGNLEVQMPKCMDVIRLAIMDTLQDQFSHLNSENEALRTAVNNLQHENHLLQSYKQAFFDLRHFFQPEIWEQIEQQVRNVEAAVATAASTESIEHRYYSPPPSQQNCAFQALPQHPPPSQPPPDSHYPLLPTSDTITDLPPPPPPPSPPHAVPH